MDKFDGILTVKKAKSNIAKISPKSEKEMADNMDQNKPQKPTKPDEIHNDIDGMDVREGDNNNNKINDDNFEQKTDGNTDQKTDGNSEQKTENDVTWGDVVDLDAKGDISGSSINTGMENSLLGEEVFEGFENSDTEEIDKTLDKTLKGREGVAPDGSNVATPEDPLSANPDGLNAAHPGKNNANQGSQVEANMDGQKSAKTGANSEKPLSETLNQRTLRARKEHNYRQNHTGRTPPLRTSSPKPGENDSCPPSVGKEDPKKNQRHSECS